MLGFNYKPGIKFPVCYAHTHTNYMYYTINTCHSYVTKSNKVFWVHSWVASNISFPSKLIFGMQLVIFLSSVSFQWRHRPVAWKGFPFGDPHTGFGNAYWPLQFLMNALYSRSPLQCSAGESFYFSRPLNHLDWHENHFFDIELHSIAWQCREVIDSEYFLILGSS